MAARVLRISAEAGNYQQIGTRWAVIRAARHGYIAMRRFEQRCQNSQMVGHPDIVVAKIGNVLAPRLADAGIVRPGLTARTRCGKVDYAQTSVRSRHVDKGVVSHAVPDN